MNLLTHDKRMLFRFVSIVLLCVSCTAPTVSRETAAATPPPPKVRIVDPVYTEFKENTMVYSGTAASAEYFDRTHPGAVLHPDLQGTLADAETFSVTSDRGYYDEIRHVITLHDNIRAILNDTYTLTCNGIDYFIEKKLIISEDPITVFSKDIQLTGERGRINLEKNRMTVQGDIHAKIYHMSLK